MREYRSRFFAAYIDLRKALDSSGSRCPLAASGFSWGTTDSDISAVPTVLRVLCGVVAQSLSSSQFRLGWGKDGVDAFQHLYELGYGEDGGGLRLWSIIWRCQGYRP